MLCSFQGARYRVAVSPRRAETRTSAARMDGPMNGLMHDTTDSERESEDTRARRDASVKTRQERRRGIIGFGTFLQCEYKYYKYIVRSVIPWRFNSAFGIRNELLLWRTMLNVTCGRLLPNVKSFGISQLSNRLWRSSTAKQRPLSGNRTSVTSSAMLSTANV